MCLYSPGLEGEMDKTVVLPYYETTTMSVEVVRGGKLFKVYFPVNYKVRVNSIGEKRNHFLGIGVLLLVTT